MTEPSTLRNPLPDRPRLVFRVGFAGNREVPEAMHQRLIETLAGVFRTVAQRLAEIAPGTPVAASTRPRIARYYSQETPLLRLITGLAEGSDTLAVQALDRAVDDDSVKPPIAAELAAVLPFDLAAYRASRNAEFRADFDRQAARCAYILTLDGLYEKPDPDTPLARHRRAVLTAANRPFSCGTRICSWPLRTPPKPAGPAGRWKQYAAAAGLRPARRLAAYRNGTGLADRAGRRSRLCPDRVAARGGRVEEHAARLDHRPRRGLRPPATAGILPHSRAGPRTIPHARGQVAGRVLQLRQHPSAGHRSGWQAEAQADLPRTVLVPVRWTVPPSRHSSAEERSLARTVRNHSLPGIGPELPLFRALSRCLSC